MADWAFGSLVRELVWAAYSRARVARRVQKAKSGKNALLYRLILDFSMDYFHHMAGYALNVIDREFARLIETE